MHLIKDHQFTALTRTRGVFVLRRTEQRFQLYSLMTGLKKHKIISRLGRPSRAPCLSTMSRAIPTVDRSEAMARTRQREKRGTGWAGACVVQLDDD